MKIVPGGRHKVMQTTRMDVRERFSLVVAAAIVFTSVCYWIVQIDGVRKMLALAYG